MTSDTILYLRWLRMKEDMPHLNHKGTDPSFSVEEGKRGKLDRLQMQWERERAEREFYRPVEKV